MRFYKVSAIALLGLLSACGEKPAKQKPTPEVGVVTLTSQDVPLEIELAGRTSAYESSEVRPQVTGIIKQRRFQEGSIVRQGQTLYEIQPDIYHAAAAQAEANVANALATQTAADIRAQRYKPLADIEAVSKQDYADALASSKQAAAQVAQSKASLELARINLRFTRVEAPISGRISRSRFTIGALVTTGQADPLAVIERLDPMYVDIQQSSTDVTTLRRQLAAGGAGGAPSTAVRLAMEDGSPYPQLGKLEFTEQIVDPSTGSVTLRASFPNPQGLLLPGMFVRAKLVQAVARSAVLVPQAAVSRTPAGQATVMIVGPDDKIVERKIATSRTIGDKWIATDGVHAGERVVTEGLDNIKSGQRVKVVPAGAPPEAGEHGKGKGKGKTKGKGDRA
jgi:membrane fusion protein (multidrug efflux system)